MNPCAPIENKRGRRKIEIKKIEKKSNRHVTFSKRRMGLFKKASELSILCDAKIAILVQSPTNKIYSFGTPYVESVLHYCYGYGFTPTVDNDVQNSISQSRIEYLAAEKRLEKEKIMLIEELQKLEGKKNEFWWERTDFKNLGKLHQLEEYLDALERLRKSVIGRGEELNSKLESSNMITDAETCGVVSENRDEARKVDALEIPEFSSSNMITDGEICGVVYENRDDELNLDALEIPDFLTGFEGDFGCDFDDLGDVFKDVDEKDFCASALGSCSSLGNPVGV